MGRWMGWLCCALCAVRKGGERHEVGRETDFVRALGGVFGVGYCAVRGAGEGRSAGGGGFEEGDGAENAEAEEGHYSYVVGFLSGA